MYSNEDNFTKETFEDNGRFQIHPLSEEGKEAYLSKNSYNYNYIKTKKNPELLKQIEEEIKAENELKLKQLQNKNSEKEDSTQNKKEDSKETNSNSKNNESCKKADNKSKNKKGENCKKNIGSMKYKNNNKEIQKKNGKSKRKQSPGEKLANTIERLGKVPGPIISNVNNDRGKLWEYPAPYHH